MSEPFDHDAIRRAIRREAFDHDAIRRIVRQAEARRAREWRVAWARTLRAVRLCCGAALIALGRRLSGVGAMQHARMRRRRRATA